MGFDVLILEDNKVDARLMKEYLQRSGEPFGTIKIVHKRETYEDALRNFKMDLILSDYRLVEFNGLEAIRLKNIHCKDVPLIIVSATVGDEKAVELIREGAVDFLIKNNAESRLSQIAVRAIRESIEKQKRRQAEFNLRVSERRYRMFFNSSLDGIVIGKPDEGGKVIDINQSLCDLIGYSKDELLQLKTKDFVDLEDPATKKHLAIREENRAFSGELKLMHKDGYPIPVELTSKIIEFEDGEKRSFSIIRDIRDKKAAETHLVLQKDIAQIVNANTDFEKSLEQCLKRINDYLGWEFGHLYVRRNGNGDDCFQSMGLMDLAEEDRLELFVTSTRNKRFAAGEGLIGRSAKKQHFIRFDLEDHKEEFLRIESAMSAGIKSGILFPVVIGGETEAVLEFYSIREDEIGKTAEKVMKAVANQIGRLLERVKYEKELKKEKAFIETAINNLPGLFFVLDEEDQYVRVNHDFLEELGYTMEEVKQMGPLDFYQEKDHERIKKSIGKAFREGEASSIAQLKTKQGELLYYYVTRTHFRQNGKEFILGTGIDITEKHKLEELLQQVHQLARIGAWELDLVNNELSWTPVTKQIHEVEPSFEPDLETSINFYKEGESRDTITRVIQEAIENGTSYEEELQIITAKDNECWIRAIGEAEFSEGKCIRLYGSFQDIHNQKMAEKQLLESLREKEVLLMEIHHRVKNNLAIISSMMQLQAFETDNDEVIDQLMDGQSRVQTIANIHELLYKTESLSRIKFDENIRELSDHIAKTIKSDTQIELEFDLEPIELNINQAIPCSLIMNELFTNTFKHAFGERQSGRVTITLSEKGREISLRIADDGQGLPDDFSLASPTTIGHKIIQVLTNQLNGDLSWNSDKEGTRFVLKFEKKEIKGSASTLVD